MVKKVDGNKSTPLTGSSPIEGSRGVEAADLQGVDQVGKAERQGAARGVRRPTRPMTAEERQRLFQLIEEEADKLFERGGIPQGKRKVVAGAVKMAIDAATVEDETVSTTDKEMPAILKSKLEKKE